MSAAGRPPGLRIVAGEFGGRRLQGLPEASGERPTAERTREAIFSMLGPIEGAVLDLYCGSGALGLEALSRGADRATFVDLEPGSVEANVAALGVGERCSIIPRDAPGFLADTLDSFDLVLCDPPYRHPDGLGPELYALIAERLSPGARLVTESSANAPLELGVEPIRERRYGSALVRIYDAGP